MERSTRALKEIYQPTPAPETLQQIQMSQFNWAELADRLRFCQQPWRRDQKQSQEEKGRRGGAERCCQPAEPLAPLLNCSYFSTRNWIPKPFCLNPILQKETVTQEMCLKSTYPGMELPTRAVSGFRKLKTDVFRKKQRMLSSF